MRNFLFVLVLFSLLTHIKVFAQVHLADSLPVKILDTLTVKASSDNQSYLPDIVDTYLFAGKKTEVLSLQGGQANLPQNLGRTVFAKLPGVNLWDMDGAGTQMNIGSRGTDAHRAIEMNMRQNGYNTNSDMFGYPENHYTVAMQGIDHIQFVRGAASLQFGSQFGGMMNYVMKKGDPDRPVAVESSQTFGSNQLFNSFNAIGGTVGKINYYAFYDNRHGEGWRPNSAFNYQSMYADITYQFYKKGKLSFQFSRMDYWQQIAGGLTDQMFQENSRQSNRTRNYFSPKINIPAIILSYALSKKTRINITTNMIYGERSSVQFINTPNVPDTINTDIGSFNHRQVDRDFYSGYTAEFRLLHHYTLGKTKNILAAGLRYFNENTRRRQKGKGTTGSDLDFSIEGIYGINIKFHTINYAAFVENIFQLTDRFSITPGMRFEVIESNSDGVIDNASYPIAYVGKRSFPLFGVGIQYQAGQSAQLYANYSQAYRPFLYSFITPADQIGTIDPDLKDSKGYTIDIGYRGQVKDIINFDLNAFYLFYGDRIGKLTMTDNSNNYLFTTNVGNSVAQGIEAYINLSLMKLLTANSTSTTDLRLFNSLAYTHARYTDAQISKGDENVSLEGNQVEGVPDWINRAGIEFKGKKLSTTLQLSYVSQKYNDANNTIFNPTAATGIVPAYTLMDWSFSYSFGNYYTFSGGVNNLTNANYFSRRINTYPGPGILPGDGRTFYITLGIQL